MNPLQIVTRRWQEGLQCPTERTIKMFAFNRGMCAGIGSLTNQDAPDLTTLKVLKIPGFYNPGQVLRTRQLYRLNIVYEPIRIPLDQAAADNIRNLT